MKLVEIGKEISVNPDMVTAIATTYTDKHERVIVYLQDGKEAESDFSYESTKTMILNKKSKRSK